MEPSICFRFSDLPIEIALIIFKYAAKPTFSQTKEYNHVNPYKDAISLCQVSRLVRLTVLPEFLHTVLLPTRRNLEAFALALESQKEYAEKQSHIAFDYIPAVQRMWISRTTEDFLWDGDKLNLHITTLLPVLLAVPTLAVECCYLPLIVFSLRSSLVDESLDDSQSLHTDPNGDHKTSPVLIDESLEGSQSLHSDPNVGHRPSPVLGKTLIVTVKSDQFNFQDYFKYVHEKSVFFASISHLTYLIELNRDLDTFRDISKGFKSPDFPLGSWMSVIPWDRMNNLETFSVVYPHLGLPQKTNLSFDQGVDLHVERLIVSVPLYRKRAPGCFPWVTAPFAVTPPGEESAPTNGLSFKVTHDQGHFQRFDFTWEKVWACGLTD